MKQFIVALALLLPAIAFSQTYEYDSSLTQLENFDKGFIDTFSVNNTAFRIVPDKAGKFKGRLMLQKNADGSWQDRFSFGYPIDVHAVHYEIKLDVNCDGYKDLTVNSKHLRDGYIFDPATNEFAKTYVPAGYDAVMLDPEKHIIASIDNDEGLVNGISVMYKITPDFKQYAYYYMFITDNSTGTKKTCTLYKCANGNVNSRVKVDVTTVPAENFSFYADYWKSRYAKLMAGVQ